MDTGCLIVRYSLQKLDARVVFCIKNNDIYRVFFQTERLLLSLRNFRTRLSRSIETCSVIKEKSSNNCIIKRKGQWCKSGDSGHDGINTHSWLFLREIWNMIFLKCYFCTRKTPFYDDLSCLCRGAFSWLIKFIVESQLNIIFYNLDII